MICPDLFKIYQRTDLEMATLRSLPPTIAPGKLLAIIAASAKSTPAGQNAARNLPSWTG